MRTRKSAVGFLAIFALAIGLPLLRPPSASAVLAPLTDDDYTKFNAPDQNGTQPVLKLQGGSPPLKDFLRFNLSVGSILPTGTTAAQVQKATLTLFVDTISTSGTFNVNALNAQVTPWTELT